MTSPRISSPPWRELFPGSVAAEWAAADSSGGLEPERALIRDSVERRRGEFLGARDAARRALSRLGGPQVPLLADGDGPPVWPEGFVGSLSHSAQRCAVAIAEAKRFRGLGLDLEFVRPLAPRLTERLLTPHERDRLAGCDAAERELLTILVFSAKECFYKCQWPTTRRFVGFHEAEIEWDDGGFLVRPLTALPGWPETAVRGRWCRHEDFVVTALSLPR